MSPHGENEPTEGPAQKRRRVEPEMPHTPPSEEEFDMFRAEAPKMFDDDPHQLMLRSIALTLEHVGFSGATTEAMQAFCAEVDTCTSQITAARSPVLTTLDAAHFLSKVSSSMLNARRSQTTPLDFKYALAAFDLPIASISPHLKHPIPASKVVIQLEQLPSTDLATASILPVLGPALSGEPDKASKAYIPKRFISFPSKHTYKWTEKESARETDPRKIREEAAKAARMGEEALRRLTKVAKAGKEKDVKNAAAKDPTSKERHAMWERTMETLSNGNLKAREAEENDRGLIVNAERSYMRKGAPAKRKVAPVMEGL